MSCCPGAVGSVLSDGRVLFMRRRGVEQDEWPDAFREIVGELPEGYGSFEGGGVNPLFLDT